MLWLLDIQLTELAELRRGVNAKNDTNTSISTTNAIGFSEIEYRKLREIFHSFLNRDTVHVSERYSLCSYIYINRRQLV